MWIGADVIKTHNSIGVDKHVSTKLPEVAPRFARPITLEHRDHIIPSDCWFDQSPQSSPRDSIGSVKLAFGVNDNWPFQLRCLCIVQSKLARIKCYQ